MTGQLLGLPRHLPPERDALPWRGCQIAAWHTGSQKPHWMRWIDGRLDDWRGLEDVRDGFSGSLDKRTPGEGILLPDRPDASAST